MVAPARQHPFDMELVTGEQRERRAQERDVRVAAMEVVAVRTDAFDVGRDGRREVVPRLPCERVKVAMYGRRRTDGAQEQGAAGVVEGDTRDGVECGRAHLLRRLLDDAHERVGCEARRDLRELGLEEHEAQCVLQRLHFGVASEALLADDGLHARDGVGVVTRVGEDRAELGRVLLVQVLAPAQVSGTSGRRGGTGDGPAAQVMAARREEELLARVRCAARGPTR